MLLIDGGASLATPSSGSASFALPLLQQTGHVWRRLKVLDQNFSPAITMHAYLRDLDLRRFMGRKQNVVVSRIFLTGKLVRSEVPAKVVAATCGHMHRTEHLFVLNIAP